MFCNNCGKELEDGVKFCCNCGKNFNNDIIENLESKGMELINPKNYLFKWVKQFSYLTIKTVETKIKIDNLKLNIQSCTYHLGFFKGKIKESELPLNNIKEVQTKKLITYSDIVFAIFFIIIGFINPITFIFAAIFIWTGINTSIVITTKLESTIKIPANSKSDAEEFISYVNSLPNY